MYALSYDMDTSKLKDFFGKSYPNAYYEVRKELLAYGFQWIQGSVLITKNNDMANLFRAINRLKSIDWFKDAVRDIRAFRVEAWSDFTDIVKET